MARLKLWVSGYGHTAASHTSPESMDHYLVMRAFNECNEEFKKLCK
jgi:hypothetical protein